MTAGKLLSAQQLWDRSLKKKQIPNYLHSDRNKYLFASDSTSDKFSCCGQLIDSAIKCKTI